MGSNWNWLIVSIMLHPLLMSLPIAQASDSLDSFIYDYALNNIPKPRTGKLYDVSLPSNFSGMEASVIRLRTHRLWRDGANLSSFEIPPRKLPYPFTRRVDLVYQNLGNWSTNYYNVPNHTLVAPVIGLLAYDSDTNSKTPVPVLLNITRDDDPIIVRFDQNISSWSVGLMKCVEFGPNGAFGLSDMTAKRSCLARGQGHFSVVVPYEPKDEEKTKTKNKKKWWIMGIVLGGVALVILVVFGILVHKFVKWQRIREMERESSRSEGLNEIWIGNSKMPSASGIRTQPALENSYVP